MLFSLSKYTKILKYSKTIINLKFEKINLISSTLYRKNYFRSLLLYLNILYACVSTPIDSNNFSFNSFINLYYGKSHPSFYFKKNLIK